MFRITGGVLLDCEITFQKEEGVVSTNTEIIKDGNEHEKKLDNKLKVSVHLSELTEKATGQFGARLILGKWEKFLPFWARQHARFFSLHPLLFS